MNGREARNAHARARRELVRCAAVLSPEDWAGLRELPWSGGTMLGSRFVRYHGLDVAVKLIQAGAAETRPMAGMKEPGIARTKLGAEALAHTPEPAANRRVVTPE